MDTDGFISLDKKRPIGIESLAGVSLIEVLVAALILSLVATSLTYVFIAGKRHIKHAGSRGQAIELSNFYLSPLQMEVNQTQWASNCLGNNTGCPAPANNTTMGGITYSPNTTVYQNNSGTTLSKVKLTISWNETTP